MQRTVPVLLIALLLCGSALAQHHPASHPPLTPEGPFPRCTDDQLQLGGFPDHMHIWRWPAWKPLVDADGVSYGPGTYCDGRTLRGRDFPGLTQEPGRKLLGGVVLEHNPGYGPCDMLPFLALVDMARRDLTEWLGLDQPDTLVLLNTDNVDQYRSMTGQGTWRFYQWQDQRVVLQPISVLQARSLDGHAVYQLVAQWFLTAGPGCGLPLWLTHGLAEYLAEDGVHLVNYMAQFRPNGPVLLTPALVEHILGAGIDPDPGRDREMYRRASYSAFIMAWELVENRGGLAALREFLHDVQSGADPDDVATAVWGKNLAELAQSLDPVQLGEPIGEAVQSRRPHTAP